MRSDRRVHSCRVPRRLQQSCLSDCSLTDCRSDRCHKFTLAFRGTLTCSRTVCTCRCCSWKSAASDPAWRWGLFVRVSAPRHWFGHYSFLTFSMMDCRWRRSRGRMTRLTRIFHVDTRPRTQTMSRLLILFFSMNQSKIPQKRKAVFLGLHSTKSFHKGNLLNNNCFEAFECLSWNIRFVRLQRLQNILQKYILKITKIY